MKNFPAPIIVENRKNRTRQPIVIPSTCWCLEADKRWSRENCLSKTASQENQKKPKIATKKRAVNWSSSLSVRFPQILVSTNIFITEKFRRGKLQTPAIQRSIERARATKARKHKRRITRCGKKTTTTTTTTTTKRRRRRRRHIPLHS